MLSGASVLADWPQNNTNVAKWFQFPDRSSAGYDILSGTLPGGNGLPIILADDFQCTQTGPITDIHIWASWLGVAASTSTTVPPIPITLGIWSDVPAVTNATGRVPSHPGTNLWSQTFAAGQYVARPVASVPNGETFWDPDPAPAGAVLGTEFILWQYNFYPTNPFVQKFGTNYWLSVQAGTAQTGTSQPLFGWKTTATNHWNDDAVFGHVDPASGQAVGDWKELIDPKTPAGTPQRSLDFSFVLTTPPIVTNPPPPPPPPAKWLQPPNLDLGYDIAATLPYVVADDFLCTNASTISNIMIWSSFLNNQVDTNMTFTLAIWSDVVPPSPSTTPVPNFSRPGTLLWTETFTPGHYTSSVAGSGQETFYFPATGQIGADTQVYLYSFTPVKPFCQRGSANSPIVYWLSITAKPGTAATAGQYGWKTSTKHWRDDAVWGTVSGSGYAGNWQELFAPVTSAKISLDMAFQLNQGPPTPDCDPTIRPKWLQLPDTSPNGLDVLATGTNIVGDDFLCRTPGPISGITIWGSWLSDLVDTNATFVLRLWSDVPVTPGTTNKYSHPGTLLCETTFSPPQTVGTSVQRYNYHLYANNLTENFYQPDKGTAGFIGRDTQIWQYDFYPFQPSCWFQQGSPLRAPLTYWVTINYVSPAGGQYLFGAKTSVAHLLDDAVYGHLGPNLNPLGDWVDLIDPRGTNSLDLAHALYTFPVHGINKDLVNNTTANATGLQIVVAGTHVVTWHYDGTPPWPLFQVSYVGGNTVLQWSGLTLPPNGPTHVGFEMAATANPTILSMNWMLGNTLLLPMPRQGNFHWLNNGTIIVVANNLIAAPLQLSGGTVEWHTNAVALDQMTANGKRNPIGTAALPMPTDLIQPGGAAQLQLPFPPSSAMYELIIVVLTDPQGGSSTTDYLLMPLDAALMPQIGGATVGGPNVTIFWSAIPGRTYRIQGKTDLKMPWGDSGLGDIMAVDGMMNAMVPMMGTQAFYRVYLLPQ
jgi:hypothetical protein